MIKVQNRLAVIIKNIGSAWSIKFIDTQEIIKVFYFGEEEWDMFIPVRRSDA